MNKKGFLVKIGPKGELFKIIPATDNDRNFILEMEEGDIIPFDTSDSRKLWRHKKYWMMISKVFEHLPEDMLEKYRSPEMIHTEIKLQNGHYDIHITLGGKEVFVVSSKVGSTSFENMGEERFKEFIEKEAKPTILKHFLKNVDAETFDKEFMSLIFE